MKRAKKVLAMILSLAMVMAMSLTAFASTNQGANGSKNDKVDVEISALSGNEQVTLYKIAEGNYVGNGDHAFTGEYTWAKGIDEDIIKAAEGDAGKATSSLTSVQITAITNGLLLDDGKEGKITPLEKIGPTDVTGATFTANVGVGAYIAVITSRDPNTVYNPIYLTASYDASGYLVGGSIATTDLYGTTAVAKRSQPSVDKEITGGTTTDISNNDIKTVSVGDVVDYKVTPVIPVYPTNANNKTFFITDTMETGLDFEQNSLEITVGGVKATLADEKYTLNGKEIATVNFSNINGFRLNFVYENILTAENVPDTVVITYSARVNENAVVGRDGNDNTVTMYYANNPTQGGTFTPENPEDTPDNAEGVVSKNDQETVYTYKIAFKKIDSTTNEALKDAIFGIYADEACTDLVDTVKTNENGYGVSTRVASGKYYVKEIAAPQGYSLSEEVYEVTASWTSAMTTTTTETSTVEYTTVLDEASEPKIQVGWIFDGKFYQNKPDDTDADENKKAKPAYIKSASTTTVTTTDTKINEDATTGGGTVAIGTDIPNTKLGALPSTGGIGTTIFTIGGCIIMICAAGLFFASRRKKAEN